MTKKKMAEWKAKGLERLHLVQEKDFNYTVDKLQNAYKTMKKQADNNARLSADLVEQCQQLSSQVDELTEENEKLREEIERLRTSLDEIRMHIDDTLY